MLKRNSFAFQWMRKHIFYVLWSFLWLGVLYLLSSRSNNVDHQPAPSNQRLLEERLNGLETRLRKQIEGNSQLLDKYRYLAANAEEHVQQVQQADNHVNQESGGVDNKDKEEERLEEKKEVEEEEKGTEKNEDEEIVPGKDEPGQGKPNQVIPILLFACNRVTVNKALDLLITYRPDKELFPIIVTQDCGHKETADVIKGYGDQVISIQQPDLSEPAVPAKEIKFKGYFKIARHYGWALNQTFNVFNYDQVVIVEDDLEVSPDFYEYFSATLPLLKTDSSLWCVSAWNDNGKQGLIDENAADLLYRTDFFPGLGWMITKGINNIIKIITCFTNFLNSDYPSKIYIKIYQILFKNFYSYIADVYDAPVHSLDEIKQGNIEEEGAVRITYRTKENFKQFSKALGIMDDFKSGVPRMAYRGVISLMHKNRRVYLSPNLNWAGYNPTWS
ncbi:alpha-1,3-mannosyl-glycoprotein 2-beta-N-acetylglucosaminyltransferase [Eurytemora carolleeae]|uniref:alpha-1,3-mannosyl-glycoprotein 2-beta-N-acetylglucosaminyltransferase n=1 Tax=Eurytemora carolleeae TaxID=1294199 RepID=UPI000C781313|nr:alpha-1,3-mannosyl-glycoprotein 2-beta-N-acetylglucosaminyltransferase [Eurytemora carolleeae]|eukprot:XP_023326519.1 alpha-1,3-mannosyl-glycoprotein 2-beta-N-acetylglucosaminyltransferase-like [Eurytemora affinis]